MESKYSIVHTDDQSYSLFSHDYNEVMHSTSGAYEEALYKHVYASRILECCHDELWALDIGFGIGYNVLALLTEFLQKTSNQILRIISLESDLSYLHLLKEIRFGDERDFIYDNIKSAFEKGQYSTQRYIHRVIYGDARDSIKKLRGMGFDAVFHDPYSPSKNPELWSVDFFREIKRLISEHGILTTYSSALHIRKSLLDVGFRIGRGPSIGWKREGTLATRLGNIPYLSDTEIQTLCNNIRSTPYRDRLLCTSREDILKHRIMQMRLKRLNEVL